MSSWSSGMSAYMVIATTTCPANTRPQVTQSISFQTLFFSHPPPKRCSLHFVWQWVPEACVAASSIAVKTSAEAPAQILTTADATTPFYSIGNGACTCSWVANVLKPGRCHSAARVLVACNRAEVYDGLRSRRSHCCWC